MFILITEPSGTSETCKICCYRPLLFQIIVIAFDNWEVHCYDSNLQLLWEKMLMEDVQPRDMYMIKSMGILIASNKLEKDDEGVVIIGGSLEHMGHKSR